MNQSYQIARMFQNESWLVVVKPPGWLTIPARRVEGLKIQDRPCLVEELKRQGEEQLYVVHRLDAEVSGLLLFARTSTAHRLGCQWFENHVIKKYYEAWTLRIPNQPYPMGEVEWRMHLARGKRRSFEVDSHAPQGKLAVTRAKVMGEVSEAKGADAAYADFLPTSQTALIWRLQPLTGRTHQLRVALAKNYGPILGDVLYGFKNNEASSGAPAAAVKNNRIALKAIHLDFSGVPDEDRLGLPAGITV